MPERVAIVGSRLYPFLMKVRAYVASLPKGTVIVSGGAKGVDLAAEREAKLLGLETAIYLPNYEKFGPSAPLVRNKLIVANCDRLVAFRRNLSAGTTHSIGIAYKLGKPVLIFDE